MYTFKNCVKICCIVSKVCAQWSLPSKAIYTQSLQADQDDVSTHNYCPISQLQKMVQKLMNRNIKGENIGQWTLYL